MQKTEYRCVGGCVGGWGNDSLVLTLVRQKKTTFSGTMVPWYHGTTSTADDARPHECREFRSSLRYVQHNNTQQQVQRKNVNRKNVNSSTVLVSGYEYERVEDRLPMCRGVCRGV